MPELPEVETIRRQLAKKIIGKKLAGQEIVKVRRRGKFLIIDFDNGSCLIFHLKLTGQLIFNGSPNKYTRKVFNFDDKTKLIFNCSRKLGWWKKVKNSKKIEESLGLEPIGPGFTLPIFSKLLKKRPNSKIKPLLMDQKFIAGIGNIYSDEILFAACVRPSRRVKTLTKREIEKIFQSIGKILRAAIKAKGSSVQHYVDACGHKGNYLRCLKVYHKKQCSVCGAEIKKIKIGGRSAHYCPECQK